MAVALDKHPVSILMEHCVSKKIHVEFIESKTDDYEFCVTVCLSHRKSGQAVAANKKDAKKLAATEVLQKLGIICPGEDAKFTMKDPVSELMEYAHSLRKMLTFTEYVKSGPDHKPSFSTSACMEDVVYPRATASQKIQAKKSAAVLALEVLYETADPEQSESDCEVLGDKHPVSELNELAQINKLKIIFAPFTKVGADHISQFQTAVVINDHTFPVGNGKSKSDAKKNAADNALQELKERPDFITRNHAMDDKLTQSSHSPQSNAYHRRGQRTSSNRNQNSRRNKIANDILKPVPNNTKNVPNNVPKNASVDAAGHTDKLDLKDPVSVLHEYALPRRKAVDFHEMAIDGPSHSPVFNVYCTVGDLTSCTVRAKQLQTAKKLAAHSALEMILMDARNRLPEANQITVRSFQGPNKTSPMTKPDKFASLVNGVLSIVEDAQLTCFSKDKVVAAMIMTRGNEQPEVISIGTGNRCILGKHLTSDGTVVCHSHAEIIARRGLIRYLYQQLQAEASKHNSGRDRSQQNNSILQLTGNKFRVRANVQFHLYISRPPCGDASAFSSISNEPRKRKQLERQGVLRALFEDGEGAIPTSTEASPASFQQLTSGAQRLRVMSCSDKICRWNVLGLQGALLSHFLEPIYLQYVCIGSHIGQQMEHLPRAIFGRVTGIGALPTFYRVQKPATGDVSDSMEVPYSLPNSKATSINWITNDDSVEVLDGMTGLKIDVCNSESSRSRVSSAALFEEFHKTCHLYNWPKFNKMQYRKAKYAATEYNRAKAILYDYFVQRGLGTWITLPAEVGNFG